MKTRIALLLAVCYIGVTFFAIKTVKARKWPEIVGLEMSRKGERP